MSEDYKKIALEDVKVGQRVRVVERHSAYTATYESVVLRTHTKWHEIGMGEEGDEITIFVTPNPGVDFDILLLEDAPKPKVVRTTTVKYYDDGTKEETVMVPMEVKTMEQFYSYEDYLKTATLRDRTGANWKYVSGTWTVKRAYSPLWLNADYNTLEKHLPMTVVGDEVD